MFRLSKVTDYGIVLLAQLAQSEDRSAQNAHKLALEVDLPVPMVSKILKSLVRHEILESQRGSKGGYRLSRPPAQVTVADMIAALEGPLGLTECTLAPDLCSHEGSCAVQGPWQVINRVIHEALETVTLADLIDPNFTKEASMQDIFKNSLDVVGSRDLAGME
jgi:FeS assembly SUF system regulator